MDVMLQCEGIVSSKNASGQATHTIKVGIVSTRVQSLPADFVYNPAKSFINKHNEIFCYNHSISLYSSVCLLKKKFLEKLFCYNHSDFVSNPSKPHLNIVG